MTQRKLVLFIAASLDGYIATKDHSLDWLFAVEGEGDNGISRFTDTVDTILLGRTTYDWIMAHEGGDFPYKDKECYVFSRQERSDTEHVKFVREDVATLTANLKRKQGNSIWLMGGGELLGAFIHEKLVDEIIVTIAPVLIGKGISLFPEDGFQTQLSLESVTRFGQFVELHYKVVK